MTIRFAILASSFMLLATSTSARPIFDTDQQSLTVDQHTGAITYCVLSVSGTIYNPEPAGVCGRIGTATPNPVIPSLMISNPFGTSIGFTSLITNVYSGQITQCVYGYNQGTIKGNCAVIGTAAQ